jgi:hypothetical protein
MQRTNLIRHGASYEAASRVMPVQRLFNRGRIASKFPVENLPVFMRSVASQADASLVAASEREADLYKKIQPEFRKRLEQAEKQSE